MINNNKIVSFELIESITEKYRKNGLKVIMCHGTFDLMHTGHIRYLQKAKSKGDKLVVTVTGDKFVNKGPDRPVFNELLRAESLAALECVDNVVINYDITGINAIKLIKPFLYVKGDEYKDMSLDVTGNIKLEKLAVEEFGGSIFFTEEITFSSTKLINDHFGLFPPKTKSYLRNLSDKFKPIDIHKKIDITI